jgi:hypothetical protein
MIITSNALPERDLDVGFFFPTFVLCLRDFVLDISGNGTPDAYFEDSLDPDIKGDKEKVKKYNEIRISILEHFQRRKCFVFDRPAGRDTLKKLEEASESDLSKDFRHDTEKFLQYMYICKPKEMIDGSPINGRSKSLNISEMYEKINKNQDFNLIFFLRTFSLKIIAENNKTKTWSNNKSKQEIKFGKNTNIFAKKA